VREHKRIAVVLPVGPKDGPGAVDTLASVIRYAGESWIVVVVDDTGPQSGLADRVREMSQDIVVLPAPPRASGGQGGLWVKITAGYQWLLQRYAPDVILRLDVDALLIGPGLADHAVQEFAKDPRVGLIGSYRIKSDGEIRDWSWAARRIRIETGPWGLIHPDCRKALRELILHANDNGYVAGEHPLGGGYIHSLMAADELQARGWFQLPSLARSNLGEDMIMGLVTVAAGYRIADFGRSGDPLSMRWRGLPAHPNELLAQKKLLTHSVRYWADLEEPEIRRIFRDARTAGSVADKKSN
jgi:hypothetical protein